MKDKNSGFNLFELLIVMAIISILSMITIPGFTQIYVQSKMDVIAVQLAEIFRYAQGEALRQNQQVVICSAVLNQNGSMNNCIARSRANDWSHGALAYIDYEHNHKYNSNDRLKWFRFESASFSTVQIKGDSLYFVDPDAKIHSTSLNNNFCFYFSAKNYPTLKAVLSFNKYGMLDFIELFTIVKINLQLLIRS